MATGSSRELIIAYHVSELEKVSSIKTVERTTINYKDLSSFAVTQFPVAAVVGGLPIPREKISSRNGYVVDTIISGLKIDTYVYIQEVVEPDVVLSNIADDMWAKLYSLQKYNGLALSSTIEFNQAPQFWKPFIAFKITSSIVYKHNTGGI